jgi:hypothetical protein
MDLSVLLKGNETFYVPQHEQGKGQHNFRFLYLWNASKNILNFFG